MDTQSLTGRLPGLRTDTKDADTAVRARTLARGLAIGAAGVLLDWGGNQFGWWWVTVLTGIAAALLLRGRALAVFTLAVPLVSWGGDLFRLWTEMDTTRISRVTIGLAGISDDAAWLGYVLTLSYAVLLCAAGAWVTAAARQVVRATREVRHGAEAVSVPAEAQTEVRTEQEETLSDV
jgi:HAMP domain-containing protein